MRVVIVGAGLIGVSTAYFLAEAGAGVVVLERRPGPGMETSFANGGMLTPSQADPWNAPGTLAKLLKWIGREDAPLLLRPSVLPALLPLGMRFLRNSTAARFRDHLARNARLAAYSVRVLRALRDRPGLRYDESTVGSLRVFRDPDSFESALRLCDALDRAGVRWRALDVQGMLDVEPALGPVAHRLAGGIHYPDDEAGDARQYCEALAAQAARRGAEFRYGTGVLELLPDRGLVSSARTTAGVIEADRWVLAAGSYSPGLARSLRVRIPVQPVKGYSLTLDMSGWEKAPRLPVVDEDRHTAATPLGRRLRVAGTAEFAGFNAGVDDARIDNLRRFVQDFYPGFGPLPDRAGCGAWAGLRPYACDGVPLLGATRLANLYLNTGHGHLGWTMAAGSGRLVADLVLGRAPEIDPAPYSPARF